MAHETGASFAYTLVGEGHMWLDGVHIRHCHRDLLTKSIAAAIIGTSPHALLGLARPPYGEYGPWEAPFGRGLLPTNPSFSEVARAPPFFFRGPPRPMGIRRLMDINVRPVR